MNTQLNALVEQAVLDRMRAKEAFTALDVSNTLKAHCYPVRHSETASIIRDVFQSGAMAYYNYGRRLIDVVTEGGSKKTQAFLYLHDDTREREYQQRCQDALPPVPADQARDISDCDQTPFPSSSVRRASKVSTPRVRQGRRDGALAIPRAFVQQLGWMPGMALTLKCENGQMQIVSRPPIEDESEVRVWSGGRVRLCKTKLRLSELTAECVTVQVEGATLKIAEGKSTKRTRE